MVEKLGNLVGFLYLVEKFGTFLHQLLGENIVPWDQGTKLSLNTPEQDFCVLGVITPGTPLPESRLLTKFE